MKYTTLGNTDLKVSKICLGTMTWGQQNTEAHGHQQMDYALDQGVNFWDTAELYSIPPRKETQGSTERIIGTWFNNNGKRDRVVLATKIAGPMPNLDYFGHPVGFSRESIFQAVEGSLQRLQTDYIDLYQLHWPERKTNFFGRKGYSHREDDPWQDNFQEILHAFEDLIKEGKIRHFGISNETPWGFMNFLRLSSQNGLPRPVSVQNPYSLLNRTYEIGMAEMSIRENAGLLAYSPLAFGLLSGKFHKGTDKPQDRLNQFKRQYTRYSSPYSWKATEKYIDIAEKNGLTPTQMALAYVNTRPFVTSNIIGATDMEQLKENIGSIEVEMPRSLEKEIEKVHEEFSSPAP